MAMEKRNEIPTKKKGLYMDEAISETSKSIVKMWKMKLRNGINGCETQWNSNYNRKKKQTKKANKSLITFGVNLIHRVRTIQLYFNLSEQFGPYRISNGKIRHHFRISGIAMWFTLDIKSKRSIRSCKFVRNYLFITFMGFFSWYKRPTSCY